MLRELKVEDFALIKGLSVRFEPGFNVLTGETGAGKSLLVDAVGLAVGARASAELVRVGAEEAVVEALFEPSDSQGREALDAALSARGLPAAGGVMVVRRVIGSGGRHRVYINGSLATVATLAEISENLVALCGQHEHVTLTRPGEALALLDAFASATVSDFPSARTSFEVAWAALREAERRLKELEGDPAARAEREAFVRFQISEIESLAPRPGEIEDLEAERLRLSSAGRLREITEEAEAALYSSDDAVAAVLARTLRRLEDCAALDPQLKETALALASAMALVSDSGRELGDYARRVDSDPGRMNQVEGRLTSLRRLARRHGGDLSNACDLLDTLRHELTELEEHEHRFEEARRSLEVVVAAASRAAARLTLARVEAARRLDDQVRQGLEQLRMSDGRVALLVSGHQLCSAGADRVEIGLATDPGVPLRPIAKVASGGELSRLLLAFRRAIAEVDGVPTVVFDEVDAGVGGAVAEAVGRLMAEVAGGRQVLCVTHLPQLAVHASHHLVVTKVVASGRAVIDVAQVAGEARVREVARMLAGAEVTASTMANALDLLEAASQASKVVPLAIRSVEAKRRPPRRRAKARLRSTVA